MILREKFFTLRRMTALAVLMVMLSFCIYQIYAYMPVNTKNVPGFVHAKGNVLHDIHNEPFTLQGTNIGGWLVPEGWMSNMYIFGQNDDKTGEKLTYLKLIDALLSNKTVATQEKAEELLQVFIDNWFTEEDVKIIKGMGLNCIRVPFGWFNLYTSDGILKQNAFEWLDKCVQWCEKNEIYIILDCHGAFGSQNREHHSGDDTQLSLFLDRKYQDYTTNMWIEVANRYKSYRYVAGYDILNEPTG